MQIEFAKMSASELRIFAKLLPVLYSKTKKAKQAAFSVIKSYDIDILKALSATGSNNNSI
jgi:hypothetical protein